MSSVFAPLDDVDIIGLLLMATVTFDCSGARFAEDVDDGEGSALLDLLDGLSDRLFFSAQTVAEMESLFRRKAGEERKGLGVALRRISSAKTAIADISVPIEGISDLGRLLLEIEARVDEMFGVYDFGYSAVANRLLALARQRTGPLYDAAAIASAHAQGRQRYDADVPPGYCDDAAWCARNNYTKGKPKAQPASFGDYVMWQQILEHASRTRRSVLLVTNDKKPDWWQLDASGERLAPLSALREEMQREAGQTFYAITFDDFRRLAPKTLQRAHATPLVTSPRAVVRRPDGASIPAWMLNATPRVPIGLHRLLAETDLASKYGRLQMPFDLVGLTRPSSSTQAALRAYNDITGLHSPAYLNSLISQATKVPTYMDALRALDATKAPTYMDALRAVGATKAPLYMDALRALGATKAPTYLDALRAANATKGILPERLSIMDEIKSGSYLSRQLGLAGGKSGSTLREVQRLMMKPYGIGPAFDATRIGTLGAEFVANEHRMVRLALGDDAELVGLSAISHPQIRDYAETHDLMDVPVRKVVAAMREERLRRERDGQTAAEAQVER